MCFRCRGDTGIPQSQTHTPGNCRQDELSPSDTSSVAEEGGKTVRGLKYSRISDEELTAVIKEYNRDHENAGKFRVSVHFGSM